MNLPWLIVGSGAGVWTDLARWGDRPALVIAVNRMIAEYPADIWSGATLHPENAESYRAGRGEACRLFAPGPAPGVTDEFPKQVMWNGTSGLYAVRIALAHGARAVVLAGVPLDEGQTIDGAPSLRPWLPQYRMGWTKARGELAGRVRSLSGWTARMLGTPDDAWISQQVRPANSVPADAPHGAANIGA